MAELAAYQEWLASGIADRAVVECIEIDHSALASKVRLARWHEALTVTHENGQQRTYQAADFSLEPAQVSDNTNQATQGVIAALDGLIYDKLFAMTAEERNEPMSVTHRLFFADAPTQPLIDPPPVWQVLAIEANVETITAELSAVPLRARTVGTYYTLANFPILKYV